MINEALLSSEMQSCKWVIGLVGRSTLRVMMNKGTITWKSGFVGGRGNIYKYGT